LAKETLSVVERAIERLPPSQRTVITLRDVEGWTADEVRNALELSETNQRVLLHRARAKVRNALEQYLSEEQ
jgi:RNA polymerase sigma-70 factor (ECF subfamily)